MTTKIVDVQKGGVLEDGRKLPPTQAAMHVEHSELGNSKTFGGTFVVKRLTIGEVGQVRSWNANEGMVSVHGEEWAARCAESLEPGESVEIVRVRNRMRLDVRRADGDGER